MRTTVLLQDVATFRIDPARLRSPDVALHLVASPDRARAAERSDPPVFDTVTTVAPFDDDTVESAVRGLVAAHAGGDLSTVSVVTHDEYALGTAARVRERLGIAGATYRQVQPFIDKLEMKRRCERAGLPVPRHVRYDASRFRERGEAYLDELVAAVGLPAFVKPIDESGSVGTALLRTREELAGWCRSMPAGHVFELDTYVEGTLYHCDSVIQGGSLVHVAASRYAHPCYDYLSGKICASIVLPDADPVAAEIKDFNTGVLRALGDIPADTATHLEVFRTASGELVFLEIAARAPAAAVPPAYERRFGFNIEEAHLKLQMGTWRQPPPAAGPYAAWAFFPPRQGVVRARREPPLSSEHRIEWLVDVGDRLEDPSDIRVAAGRVLLWNDDYPTLERDFASLDTFVPLDMADLAQATA